MIKLFNKTQYRPIGLDIGHSSIKMIQLSRDDDTIAVVGAQDTAIEPQLQQDPAARNAFIIQSIRQMYARGGFSGRQVVSCLPGDAVKIKSLRLDTDQPEEIERYMCDEVASRFGLNPDVDELRYVVAGNVFQGEQIKNEVIFFGIDRRSLSDYIEMLEEAHLEPVAIDTVPCALFRSFQTSLRRREDRELVSVLVDLGSHFTTVIIGKGPQIIFVKQIPIAGENLTREVASKLSIEYHEAALLRNKLRNLQTSEIDEETARAVIDAMNNTIESLAMEISLCFKYYAVTFRGQKPTEAMFAGGEAYESTLMDALKRHLGVEIRIAEPLRGFDLSRSGIERRRNPQMCEWAVAVGLGMKGWEIQEGTIQTEEISEAAV